MAMNLQGSSHRPRAVGFRLRNRKDFIYETWNVKSTVDGRPLPERWYFKMSGILGYILLFTLVSLSVYVIILKKQGTGLNSIKNKQVGDGQMGTARFSTHDELEGTFKRVEYRPDLWRQGIDLPEYQGLIVHCENIHGEKSENLNILTKNKKTAQDAPEKEQPMYAYVDDGDVHTLMIGASGIGKTANFLYPNIEYAFASGMSFLTTDTKGDLYRNTGTIGEKYYGYEIKVIDLRNPLESSRYNMLYLVNKYMHLYKKTGDVKYQAKAEKYAKITSKTIVMAGADSSDMGQNAYFYDSAEGIVTAALLILAQYAGPGEAHIVSCFKLIQEFMKPSGIDGRIQFQALLDYIRSDDRARMYAATALNSAPETLQSVMSTAMSKLLSFLDSELEQILCFKNELDTERFCNTKTAIYLVLPEEDTTKHFIASLFIQQIYRELLLVADSKGGHLDNRVMLYCDELGTMPQIQGMEAMFSAARSRKVSIVAIIQSLAQFEKTYGKEGAEIIADNCQLTIFGGFAPNSETAKRLSENLGNQTVETGSISYQQGGGFSELFKSTKTIQMSQRALITTDELKNMPKGHFIVMKTGCNPFKTQLKLFLRWGVRFEEPYTVPAREQMQPRYVNKENLIKRILIANPDIEDPTPEDDVPPDIKK